MNTFPTHSLPTPHPSLLIPIPSRTPASSGTLHAFQFSDPNGCRMKGDAERSTDLVEVSILLRPLPSSPWITSCWAMRESTISISHCVESEAHKQAAPLTIIGVRLDD